MNTLVKSARRLAMEVRGKKRTDAENWLVKYGASVSGAAASIALILGSQSQLVVGSEDEIACAIEMNC